MAQGEGCKIVEPQKTPIYGFGRFEFTPDQMLLKRDGEVVHIGSRALKLLLALLERRGEIIQRDELVKLVWPGQAVQDGNLRVQIGTLRKILADGAGSVGPIKTIPAHGYAFLAPVAHR